MQPCRRFLHLTVATLLLAVGGALSVAGCQKQESLDGAVAAEVKSKDNAAALQKEAGQRVKDGEAVLDGSK